MVTVFNLFYFAVSKISVIFLIRTPNIALDHRKNIARSVFSSLPMTLYFCLLETGRKLKVNSTFRRRPGILRPVSR